MKIIASFLAINTSYNDQGDIFKSYQLSGISIKEQMSAIENCKSKKLEKIKYGDKFEGPKNQIEIKQSYERRSRWKAIWFERRKELESKNSRHWQANKQALTWSLTHSPNFSKINHLNSNWNIFCCCYCIFIYIYTNIRKIFKLFNRSSLSLS